jgi:hypothetical protein
MSITRFKIIVIIVNNVNIIFVMGIFVIIIIDIIIIEILSRINTLWILLRWQSFFIFDNKLTIISDGFIKSILRTRLLLGQTWFALIEEVMHSSHTDYWEFLNICHKWIDHKMIYQNLTFINGTDFFHQISIFTNILLLKFKELSTNILLSSYNKFALFWTPKTS